MKQLGVLKKNSFRRKYANYAKALINKDDTTVEETSEKQKE